MDEAGPAAAFAESAPHLLVIDDDSRIRSLLQRWLGERGFRVSTAADAAEAREKLRSLVFDLLIVDIMMPGEDGLSLTRSLARTETAPILLLTARVETENRIEGLEAGADDYLPKPFDPRELVLRINNILKRRAPPAQQASGEIRLGEFTLNLDRGELRRGGEAVRLTEREREMLAILAARPGETVPRAALVGEGEPTGERAVDVQINRLRRKIEKDPANPVILQTVRGVGYRLVCG